MKILHVVFLILFFSPAAFAGEVSYVYDEAGRLSGVFHHDSGRASYIYDAMGNLLCRGSTCDIYVEPGKACGGKKPCYDRINGGIKAAGFGARLNIASGTAYSENISMSDDCELIIQGGWNADFSSKSGASTVDGALTISNGHVVVEGIVFQ